MTPFMSKYCFFLRAHEKRERDRAERELLVKSNKKLYVSTRNNRERERFVERKTERKNERASKTRTALLSRVLFLVAEKERERERKEIYRTITRSGLFLPRKKQKFNRRCLGGGRKEDAARTKLSMSGTPAALTCWFNIGYRSLSHR